MPFTSFCSLLFLPNFDRSLHKIFGQKQGETDLCLGGHSLEQTLVYLLMGMDIVIHEQNRILFG